MGIKGVIGGGSVAGCEGWCRSVRALGVIGGWIGGGIRVRVRVWELIIRRVIWERGVIALLHR